MSEILKLNHVNKSVGQTVIFNDLNLSIDEGHIVGMFGPSGCGKTQLLRMIAGLNGDYDGAILINGRMPGYASGKYISYMPSVNNLGDFPTVEYAISFFKNMYDDFDIAMARDFVFRLGLEPKHKLSELSPGLLQRARFLLTMSRDTKLYLLDNPFMCVDFAAYKEFIRILIGRYSTERTIIIASSSIRSCERVIDTALMLFGGRFIVNENADRLRAKSKQSLEEYYEEVCKC